MATLSNMMYEQSDESEQLEEEDTAKGSLEQIRSVGSSSPAIDFVDRHLGEEPNKPA